MPTYEYECENCGHSFEIMQKMSDNPKRKCPECGKLKLDRLIGAGGGIIFKGPGFYSTDYRSKSYSDAKRAAESPCSTGSCPTDKKDSPCGPCCG